jgi:tetratricopeptide (TPR) repeat protein
MVQQLSLAAAAQLREAMLLARQGNLPAARASGEAALALAQGHGAAHALLGMICCQMGDFAAGIDHLRRAFAFNPADLTIAANLAAALIQVGDFQAAATICTPERANADASMGLWRLRGYALQQQQDYSGAIEAYRAVVGRLPEDWESWNNLGNALAAAGRSDEAIAAQTRAADLAPDSPPVRLNLAATLIEAGRFDEADALLLDLTRRYPDDPHPLTERARLLRYLYRDPEALALLEHVVTLVPGDATLWIELGEQRMVAGHHDSAEQALRRALTIDPANEDAHIRLALLLDSVNRDELLPEQLAAAARSGVAEGPAEFIRALVCRRAGDFDAGLEAISRIPPGLKPIVKAQLEGQFRDRLGDADGAFAAFTEMNRLFREDPSNPELRGQAFRDALRQEREQVTKGWYEGWRPAALPPSRSPVFLVGFPRSGTTLLDTMLMGHPDAQVLEERPPLRKAELALGTVERLADLDDAAILRLRSDYFAAVAEDIELRPDSLLIDKSPLHMNKVPLVHRLFPDARFILALRHPCDVVLSCFMTAFRLNDAMASLLDLETAADFYDLSFRHWSNCTSIMPVKIHTVTYETMLADTEGELRRLLDFLALPWNEAVTDHVATARRRGTISTASYAQVTEGLYRRAAGRWERYRAHLAPVLPVLAPWAGKFGYSL